MLTKLTLKLSYERKEKLSYQISSTMHGVLMEHIDWNYGEILHLEGRKPFIQYVTDITEKTFVWTICTVNEEAKLQIIDRLVEVDEFMLKHKDLRLKVMEREVSSITYDDLIKKYYFERQPRDISIRFLTPAAFKSQGRYVFMPDIRLIFQSLMEKYDAFSTETKVSSPEVLEHFEQYAFIKKYRLHSVRFSLEGTQISAFAGECTIHVNGPEQLVNLANMMAYFGEYAGIGIKTALGMGAIQIVPGRSSIQKNRNEVEV